MQARRWALVLLGTAIAVATASCGNQSSTWRIAETPNPTGSIARRVNPSSTPGAPDWHPSSSGVIWRKQAPPPGWQTLNLGNSATLQMPSAWKPSAKEKTVAGTPIYTANFDKAGVRLQAFSRRFGDRTTRGCDITVKQIVGQFQNPQFQPARYVDAPKDLYVVECAGTGTNNGKKLNMTVVTLSHFKDTFSGNSITILYRFYDPSTCPGCDPKATTQAKADVEKMKISAGASLSTLG